MEHRVSLQWGAGGTGASRPHDGARQLWSAALAHRGQDHHNLPTDLYEPSSPDVTSLAGGALWQGELRSGDSSPIDGSDAIFDDDDDDIYTARLQAEPSQPPSPLLPQGAAQATWLMPTPRRAASVTTLSRTFLSSHAEGEAEAPEPSARHSPPAFRPSLRLGREAATSDREREVPQIAYGGGLTTDDSASNSNTILDLDGSQDGAPKLAIDIDLDDFADQLDLAEEYSDVEDLSEPDEGDTSSESEEDIDPERQLINRFARNNGGIDITELEDSTAMEDQQFLEARICANAGVSAQRCFVLPSPLTHVQQCLSSGGDHLAALRPGSGGTLSVGVYWLGAPDEALRPIPGLILPSRLPLADAMTIEPPMGRRGAVPPVLVGEVADGLQLPPGSELLAALYYDNMPARALSIRQEQALRHFVVASPVLDPSGRRRVTCYGSPAQMPMHAQDLGVWRHPKAQFSPTGLALVMQSVQPGPSLKSPARVLDGVHLFSLTRGGGGRISYGRLSRKSLVPEGATAPVFAWTRNDRRTLMAGQDGAHIFDTRFGIEPQTNHPVLRVPVPPCLRHAHAVAADGITSDPNNDFAAINWYGVDAGGEVVGRYGQLVDLAVKHGRPQAAAQGPALFVQPTAARLLTHGQGAARPLKPYGTLHFTGSDGLVVATYATQVRQLRPLPPAVARADVEEVRFSGSNNLTTYSNRRITCPLGRDVDFFAMLSQHHLRLWRPNGERIKPSRRQFMLQERRPEMLQAIAQSQGIAAKNEPMMGPWMSAHRFVFLGVDNDVILRFDIVPNQGARLPCFYEDNMKTQAAERGDTGNTRWWDRPFS